MNRANELITDYFDTRAGQLVVQGQKISEWVERFGTPCFIYDGAVIESKLQELRSAFGPDFEIYYSLKANPDPHVVEFLNARVDGIEIASAGEFDRAIRSGCKSQNVLFAGPGKDLNTLHHVISHEIGEIHAESLHELKQIDVVAGELEKKPNVCLRINPGEQNQGGAMRMGGVAAPFGMDEESIPDVISRCGEFKNINISGIHLFAGTQLLDAKTLLSQYRSFLQLAEAVSGLLGRPLQSIDFGGGLGIPYFSNESKLELAGISAELQSLARQVKSIPGFDQTRLMIEPGRFLTAESGIYISRVLDIKSSRDVHFVVVDGGMHHHLAASGNLGQVIKRNFPIACLNKLDAEEHSAYEVVGPLCTPLDRLGRKIQLPQIEPGDLLGIFCSGAYGRSASPTSFLSHTPPIEIFAHQGAFHSNRIRIEDSDG